MTISSEQFRCDSGELLRRTIKDGEEIIITENGTPVAKLVPLSRDANRSLPMTLEELREFRKGITLGPDLTIKQLIEEGRR